MLESIYILLVIIGFALLVLSLFKRQERKEIAIVPLLAMIVFAILTLSSANIEQVHCDYITTNTTATDWSCHTNAYESVGLIYFFGGITLISFVAAIVIATGEGLEEAHKQFPKQ